MFRGTESHSPPDQVERARVGAERVLLADLGPRLRASDPPESLQRARERFMRAGLRLSERMAPALHAAGREVKAALGCGASLEFFQSEAPEDNACMFSVG